MGGFVATNKQRTEERNVIFPRIYVVYVNEVSPRGIEFEFFRKIGE